VPVIYLTNWLPSTENAFLFSLLQGFDKIVIADVPGSIVVPMIIQHKVVCVGPIVDRAQHTYVSQTKGAPPKISVVAGGGVQADLPFWEKTIQAIGALSESCEVHLYPGSWFPIVASLCKQYSQHQWCVTKDYADLHHALDGCNVVIARSGHTTNWEIAVRRIPAILFPHDANTNPMSAEYAKHIQNYTPAIVHQVGDSVRCIAEDLRVLIKKPPNMPMVEIPDGVPTFLQQVFPYC
jgi:UDP-N-acetylglucosamine:LPS N-acetylglucosamine transferase